MVGCAAGVRRSGISRHGSARPVHDACATGSGTRPRYTRRRRRGAVEFRSSPVLPGAPVVTCGSLCTCPPVRLSADARARPSSVSTRTATVCFQCFRSHTRNRMRHSAAITESHLPSTSIRTGLPRQHCARADDPVFRRGMGDSDAFICLHEHVGTGNPTEPGGTQSHRGKRPRYYQAV